MKRILALVCILTLCLTAFSSCKTADSQTANYLKPVKLTESEQQLLTLTHPAEPLLLDYCVEDAASLSIDTFSPCKTVSGSRKTKSLRWLRTTPQSRCPAGLL